MNSYSDKGKEDPGKFTELTDGTIVSHYRLISKIGAGGMGEVYLAEDFELNRNVALKFLPPHLCQDADCRARFKREAQAAAKLNHPSIITIFEVSEFKNRPFFAMEHIAGDSLSDFIKRRDHSLEKIIDLSIQICEGLNKAHQSGIVHRDIKPSNIMIDQNGRVKIFDFGLAAIKGDHKLTKTGSTLGTLHYMSPEQIRGEVLDGRSDIFSFGVVLYEMITGQLPFRSDHEPAIIYAIGAEDPDPLARYKTGVPDELQRIISKMLAKDKSLRYQHADELLADLKRLSAPGVMRQAPRRDWWNRYVVTAAVIILLVIVGYWVVKEYLPMRSRKPEPVRKMLAVLPFENLGDPEDEYFADGITDEIIGKLAKLSQLGVISRTSSSRYKKTNKSVPEMGKELGVDFILEGTIKWERWGNENRVRIQSQLIKVDDDTHIWSADYNAVLKEIFELQSRIAREVVNSLNVTLLSPEQEILDSRLTDNVEAYNYYLRGKNYYDNATPKSNEVELAIQMFENAVETDTAFAEAYSWLAHLYSWMYFNAIDLTGQQLARTKDAAQKAVQLSGNGTAGKMAMGYYYYYGQRNYKAALLEFNDALKMRPNDGELLSAIGFVQRRLGLWDDALANLLRASQLDPLSPAKKLQVVLILAPTRRNKECLEILDKAIALSPDYGLFYVHKFNVLYNMHENLDELRELLETAARNYVPASQLYGIWEKYYIWRRDFKAAVEVDKGLSDELYRDSIDFYLAKTQLYQLLDNSSMTISYADSARRLLEKRLEAQPEYYDHYAKMGLALAWLGRKQEAIEASRRAVTILPISEDAYRGTLQLQGLAFTYLQVNEPDSALDILDSLLKIPSYVTVPILKIDPIYDPLRDNPRFETLLKKYEREYGM